MTNSKGSGHGLFEDTITELTWWTEENHERPQDSQWDQVPVKYKSKTLLSEPTCSLFCCIIGSNINKHLEIKDMN
jgi:hypothetical protein